MADPSDVVRNFFSAMQDRRWDDAAARLGPEVDIRWPATRERFVGPAFLAMQRAYPEGWAITVVEVLGQGDRVAVRVAVDQSGQRFWCAGFYTVLDGRISEGTEHWVTEGAEQQPAWRAPYTSTWTGSHTPRGIVTAGRYTMDVVEITVTRPLEATEQAVRAALAEQGFGVLTEIDLAATLKTKLGVERPALKILGACNPPLVHEALAIDPDVTLLLPCNVVLEAVEGGTRVRAVDPTALMAGPEFAALAAGARARLQAALDRVAAD